MIETLVTGGLIVTEAGPVEADVAIADGRIVGFTAPGRGDASPREVIDARGLVVLPGAVDVHTHFTGSHDRPAEELREGTVGAAIGGITTIVEMPHSAPPATTVAAFEAKRELLAANSCIDFALWAGIDERNLAELRDLHEAGAVAFKAFLTSGDPSGAAPDEKGLPQVRDVPLLDAMREIASFDGLIGIHAENHEILVAAKARMQAAGRHDAGAHAEAGPEIAEIEAVGRVLLFARETGVRCHVVHVSSPVAARLVAERRRDTRVTFETCPHYLVLDEDDLKRIGPNARCGPPIRPRASVDALWTHVLDGSVDMIASDHCPYLPEQKEAGRTSIWNAGMGLTGVETLGPVFFDQAVTKRGLGLAEFARMTAGAPARLMGLYPRKGAIRLGADADLAFYDPRRPWTVRGERFRGLARWSAFEGLSCNARVVRTMIRGRTVQAEGEARVPPGFGSWLAGRGRSGAGGL